MRDYETVFELDYSARIAPWWTIQPDIQHVIHPNGGQSPTDPMQRIGNAFVAGIRSTVKFWPMPDRVCAESIVRNATDAT